jgi:hypothetical protein
MSLFDMLSALVWPTNRYCEWHSDYRTIGERHAYAVDESYPTGDDVIAYDVSIYEHKPTGERKIWARRDDEKDRQFIEGGTDDVDEIGMHIRRSHGRRFCSLRSIDAIRAEYNVGEQE